MDLFWIKLILSFFIGGTYIAFTIWIAEKFGSKIGGIILGLPSTTLVSLIFIAWTQDVSAVLTALPTTTAALSVSALFVSAFILSYRYGIKIAFSIAFLIWGSLGVLLVLLKLDLLFSILFAIGIYAITIPILNRFPDKKIDNTTSSHAEFFYRAIFAGSVIFTAVLLGKYLGPVWGGVFGVFPAGFTSSLYLLSNKHGFGFTASVARTMPLGSIGSVVFVIALYYLISIVGFVPAIAISYMLSAVYAILLYFIFLNK
ncbi:MAG: DUF3147 family protein [Candidatus Micrarchaeota archaeon]